MNQIINEISLENVFYFIILFETNGFSLYLTIKNVLVPYLSVEVFMLELISSWSIICDLCFFSPGFLMFKDYCENISEEAVPQLKFYEEVRLNFGYTIVSDAFTKLLILMMSLWK